MTLPTLTHTDALAILDHVEQSAGDLPLSFANDQLNFFGVNACDTTENNPPLPTNRPILGNF